MRKNPTYMALLRLTRTCLLISEKSVTYTIKWSYTIIWQVRVIMFGQSNKTECYLKTAQLTKNVLSIDI